MVGGAAKPLRGRSPGPRPKRSEAWTQVNDRAKEKKNRPGEGGADTLPFYLSFHDHCGKERGKDSSFPIHGVRSLKTFARAFAWAQAEAKRGVGPGE